MGCHWCRVAYPTAPDRPKLVVRIVGSVGLLSGTLPDTHLRD
jgi:hypothetical protein